MLRAGVIEPVECSKWAMALVPIELDDSKELTVINTHRGLFKYNRLVFGLSSSPGIFQRIMSNLLSDIPGVEVFLDDIILGTSGTPNKHLKTLEKVFQRLQSHVKTAIDSLICPTSTSERSSLEAERSEKPEVIPASVAGETQGPRSVRELSPVRAAIVEELPSVSTSGSVPRTNVFSPEGCVILPQSEDPVPEVARPRPLRACRLKKGNPDVNVIM
ncbi:unnamed protein product [Arctia plantaginis]|uniref:Reverse transcriptase domain-containing protein n=1 Tax=Arctia plantaginis TaxID=874455 RepID=A0A8S1BB33_ARCPL|nr:unnamed protein product [Arctia plantaginis]